MKVQSQPSLFVDSVPRTGATFSPCGRYRYLLWRHFNEPRIGRMINFIMLNPSTAGEVDNDPTVQRCVNRAMGWEFDSLFVTNIFAYRSTDPSILKTLDDPVGAENDDFLLSSASAAAMVVCAWGQHGWINARSVRVVEMLLSHGIPLRALHITKSGQPQHPLYLPYSLKPLPWDPMPVKGMS